MLLTISSGGVPVGNYHARFTGVEPVENDYGPGLCWRFSVVGGQYDGYTVSRTTTPNPTTQNICGKFVAGLSGQTLTAGNQVDLNNFIGETYLIVVSEGRKGGTRVEVVTRPPVTE